MVQHHHICDEQVCIQAEEGASATVFLMVSGLVDIVAHVKKHATLTVICLQVHEATITQRSILADSATIRWQNVSLAPVKHTLESRVEGPHTRSDIDWIFYAQGSEQQRISASNVFEGSNGSGDIVLRGIAKDTAHVVCNGLINIGLKGSGTDTYLTEDVLMLDRTAKVDAIPGLEIKTNDVKASHSATVSKVTDEDLFYFASRGVDHATARQMYIVGFLADITKSIANEEARIAVQNAIELRAKS